MIERFNNVELFFKLKRNSTMEFQPTFLILHFSFLILNLSILFFKNACELWYHSRVSFSHFRISANKIGKFCYQNAWNSICNYMLACCKGWYAYQNCKNQWKITVRKGNVFTFSYAYPTQPDVRFYFLIFHNFIPPNLDATPITLIYKI